MQRVFLWPRLRRLPALKTAHKKAFCQISGKFVSIAKTNYPKTLPFAEIILYLHSVFKTHILGSSITELPPRDNKRAKNIHEWSVGALCADVSAMDVGCGKPR